MQAVQPSPAGSWTQQQSSVGVPMWAEQRGKDRRTSLTALQMGTLMTMKGAG